MQVKIIIGTVAFMMTMIVLGFAALQEPARLEEFTEAREGRSIENGANIFANNCSTCHGVEGLAQTGCAHPETAEPFCVGLRLQNHSLLCGDPPERLGPDGLRWTGTVEQYIERTVAAGRPGTFMPAWSSQFGGPMRDDQVADVAAYVLNWGDPDFCANPPPDFPWPEVENLDELFVMDIPEFTAEPADAANGEALYQQYACFTCHGQIDEPGSNTVGPWLGDIAEVGATRIEGYSAAQYVYESILYPNEFLAPECPGGVACSPGLMPQDFGAQMAVEPNSPQDMIDLLAYLVGEE